LKRLKRLKRLKLSPGHTSKLYL